MKNKKLFVMMSVILAMGLAACGGNKSSKEPEPSSSEPAPSSQVQPSSTSQPGPSSTSQPGPSSTSQPGPSSTSQPGPSSTSQPGPSSSSSQPDSSSSEVPPEPVKSLNITESKFVNEGGKVYFQVTGTQENHTAEEFKWAWGIRERNANFAYGKEAPEAADFAAAEFDNNKQFVLKLCLTDIEGLKTGSFYRIYGGTPATYGDIAFTDTQADARDTSRHYYLRADQDNSFVYDNVQPLSFTLATMVEVAEADLPAGVTNAGAYLKFGGVNEAGITEAMLDEWHTAGKIAGDFQRVIGGYSRHNHVDAERFWKVEDDKVFFYVYTGFMANDEGWMMHFDMVGGNSGANLQFDNVLWGETEYVISGSSWRIYADSTKSAESDFYGCLGVKREKWVDPTAHVHAYPDDADVEYVSSDDYIATRAYNCTGTCGESVLRWNALDYDKTLSKKTTEVKVNGATANNAVKTGDAENDGGTEVKEGNHYVYKVNVSEAVEKAGLAFQIYSRSDDRQVFKAQSNDGKNGYYYDEATQTFTKAPARYGVRINGQEVYFDEALLAEEGNTPKNSLVWRDFPLNSFALNKGVNTIDVYSMAGYSQAGILQFQLTGLPKVAVSHKHTLGEWQSDENNHWKECSGDGCTLAAHAHLQEAAHEWGDKYDEVAATCQAKGSYKQACKVCGYVKTVETALAGHTLGEAQEKVGKLTPHVCTVCNKAIYELSFADTDPAVSASKLKTDAKWDVTGLPAGTYEVILYACAANTTLPENIRTGNNHDEVGRYQFRFGTGDYVDPTAGTYASFGLGEGESADKCKWTTSLCQLVAEEGTAQFEIHWTNKGYSCFMGGVALVKVA